MDINCVDYDRDGWNDLYVTTNGNYERGRAEVWRKRRDGTLEAVTTGIAEIPNGWVVLALPVDFNGDGWLDIFAPLSGAAFGTRAYINNGGLGFTLAPFNGLDRGVFLVDADRDGRPDLYWAGHVPFRQSCI